MDSQKTDPDMPVNSPDGETKGSDIRGSSQMQGQPDTSTKKPSKMKQIWDSAGLDLPTLMMMLKGSLPPTIAIAMYQAEDVASVYSTLGYLVAIASILGMCILPRGVFIQNTALNVLAICVGAATNLLALYTAIQARIHTTPPGASPAGYNSSACAVLAIWLIFQTYLTNALRAQLPQFQFPVILYSIFMIVSLTYGTQFPNMTAALSFMQRLLEAFLTGFAIATGVSLFVFPVSSRKVVFKEFQGYLGLMGGMLMTQTAFLQSLETFEPETSVRRSSDLAKDRKSRHGKGDPKPPLLSTLPEAVKLKELVGQLYALHTKLPADVRFAKREVAVGKLSSKQISELWKKIRLPFVPITGLSTTLDILQLKSEELAGFAKESPTEQEINARKSQTETLHQMMRALHEPFGTMSSSINSAFKHVLITLEIEKAPKVKPDEESQGNKPAPGSVGFAEAYKKELDDFFVSKKRSVKEWCHHHDVELPSDFFEATFVRPDTMLNEHMNDKDQRQLFFVLHVEYLLWRAGQAALELILHVDQLKQEGALSKTKLIVPGGRTLKKWLTAIFGREDTSDEEHFTGDVDHGASTSLNLGESYLQRKDPEHLPPRNTWEKVGELIRHIPIALRSDASAFGFRVSAATMSVVIICYLHDSQTWFLQNRILWATIMVPLSMTRTAGQSTWTFLLRILGTAIAMVGSYVVWYIVDGKTPGVIVFLWLWMFCNFYIVLKKPKLVIVGILTIVTAILIIGYELQTREVGVAASESNGQPAYPTYLLAPYRLGTVCGGLFVAYFWTIFPYPISESTELRKDLGAALYLLANTYSIVHETLRSCVLQIDGLSDVKGTRAYHLEKARLQVFTKLIAILTTLHQNSAFSKMQLRVGGRFPREEYEGLIQCVQRVLQYLALLSYTSSTFSAASSTSEWSHDFRRLLGSINATSHRTTSLLSLLSASMLHARPLPPYLESLPPYRITQKMNSIDTDILSVRHIAEPEYSAFAVTTICAQCMHDDIAQIARHVKTLVGEIDFSFHAVSTADESPDHSSVDTFQHDEKKDHHAEV